MAANLNGLLSGKYDSTKQRAVLLNGDRLRNYRSYTATMRLELLLTGRLVFTDAQFFDGLYFHWLGKNKNEFQAFQNLMVPFRDTSAGRLPLFSISVKCRQPNSDKKECGYKETPDLDQVAVKTFCKEFQFSSIEDDALAEAVFELSSDYSEKYTHTVLYKDGKEQTETITVRLPEKTLDKYISAMSEHLKRLYGSQSSIVRNWLQYTDELKTLFGIKYVDKWGYCDDKGNWTIPKWDEICSGCFEQGFPRKAGQTYLQKMRELLDTAEGMDGMENNPAADRYFARIRSELDNGVGNRSKITTALDALEHLNNKIVVLNEKDEDRRHCQKANECFRDFRQLMNDRYNKLLAYQHGCQFLDLCDYTKIFDLINSEEVQRYVDLPMKLVKRLAELSWSSFNEIVENHKSELETAFHAWMGVYDNFSVDSDLQNFSSGVSQYLDQLICIFADRKSAHTATVKPWNTEDTATVKPWNTGNTCKESIRAICTPSYLYEYYLIGGGSFEAGIEGNEICILGVNKNAVPEKQLGLLRLRIKTLATDAENVEADHDLNTLLAPVCNPLNGGYI